MPNPSKNVGGLAAMIAMAGEYYDRTNISVEDIGESPVPGLVGRAYGRGDHSAAPAPTPAEDFALFGYSVGDGGQLLESDLLQNMQGIRTRWEDPLRIYYPDYVTWFDFPFSVVGRPRNYCPAKECSARIPAIPALGRPAKGGARSRPAPANPNIAVDAVENSLFAQWQDQGVQIVVPHDSHAQPRPRCIVDAAALVRTECCAVRPTDEPHDAHPPNL